MFSFRSVLSSLFSHLKNDSAWSLVIQKGLSEKSKFLTLFTNPFVLLLLLQKLKGKRLAKFVATLQGLPLQKSLETYLSAIQIIPGFFFQSRQNVKGTLKFENVLVWVVKEVEQGYSPVAQQGYWTTQSLLSFFNLLFYPQKKLPEMNIVLMCVQFFASHTFLFLTSIPLTNQPTKKRMKNQITKS